MVSFKLTIAAALLALLSPALATPYAAHASPSIDYHAPVKTPCATRSADPVYRASPEPVVDPIYSSPEPVVDPIYSASPEPVVDPIYSASPEPVVDPIYSASPEPVVDPIYTSPEPVVDPVYTVAPKPVHPASPEPMADPVYDSDHAREVYTAYSDDNDFSDDDDDQDDHFDAEYSDDEPAYPAVPKHSPAPKYTPHAHKPHPHHKPAPACFLQNVDLHAATAERCCEVRYDCDSPHCADSEACKHNPDVCFCRKRECKKIYLLASYKPATRLHSSCAEDVFSL